VYTTVFSLLKVDFARIEQVTYILAEWSYNSLARFLVSLVSMVCFDSFSHPCIHCIRFYFSLTTAVNNDTISIVLYQDYIVAHFVVRIMTKIFWQLCAVGSINTTAVTVAEFWLEYFVAVHVI
jgi:hypothetical protein